MTMGKRRARGPAIDPYLPARSSQGTGQGLTEMPARPGSVTSALRKSASAAGRTGPRRQPKHQFVDDTEQWLGLSLFFRQTAMTRKLRRHQQGRRSGQAAARCLKLEPVQRVQAGA